MLTEKNPAVEAESTPAIVDTPASKRSPANEQADAIAAFFLEGMTEQGPAWMKPWENGKIPDALKRDLPFNPSTGNTYRGGNLFALMGAQAHMVKEGKIDAVADPRFMTYKQAQSVGAQVRGGEKGFRILMWKEMKVAGKSAKDIDENTVDGEEERRLFAIPHTVFHASQIEGLPRYVSEPLPSVDERVNAVFDLAKQAGVRIVDGPRASYVPLADVIRMPPEVAFNSKLDYAATLLHELAHATGHSSRLNREMVSFAKDSEGYAREELRAEIASFLMGQRLGVYLDPAADNHGQQHQAYVKHWVKFVKDDPREITAAVQAAEKIASFLGVPELTRTPLPTVERAAEKAKAMEREGPAPERKSRGLER